VLPGDETSSISLSTGSAGTIDTWTGFSPAPVPAVNDLPGVPLPTTSTGARFFVSMGSDGSSTILLGERTLAGRVARRADWFAGWGAGFRRTLRFILGGPRLAASWPAEANWGPSTAEVL
jgi:hypothetical protein